MEALIGLRLPTPVGVGCQRRIDLGRMVKVAIPQPGFRSAIRAASRGDWLRFLLQKKRMGWDLNPRTTFAVAGFQGRRSPSGHCRSEHQEKLRRNAPEALGNGPPTPWPNGQNRAKPSHHKPNRDHSRDKSATSRDLSVSKWPRNGTPPPCPAPSGKAWGPAPPASRIVGNGLVRRRTPKGRVHERPREGHPCDDRCRRGRFRPGRQAPVPSRSGRRHHDSPARASARACVAQSLPPRGFADRVP